MLMTKSSTAAKRPEAGLLDGLRRCVAPVEQAASLPPACYRDDAVLKAEIETIFRRKWVAIGRADRFEATGDYETLDIAGLPLIVLRDKQGGLRAFANSCRHRGARLLDGDGNCRAIRCPFHSWTYKLDGRLAGAPRMEAARDFDKGDYGLVQFRTAEDCGFAYLCLDEEAPALDRQLGDFAQRHAPWSLDRLVSARRRVFEVACNWKAFLEVFNEYYHLPYVHPNSINGLYDLPDPADATEGAYASQFGTTGGTGGLLEDQQDHALPAMPGLSAAAAAGARYTWVFPNLTFAANRDALWVYEATPLAPERCRVAQTICFPPETMALADFEQRARHYYHRLDAAVAEDIPALENQRRGLASPFARQGRFAPLMEPSVAAFAKWYARQLLAGEAA